MKSKHSTYGKETACCSSGSYHFYDNVRRKSTIAAFAPTKTAIDFKIIVR